VKKPRCLLVFEQSFRSEITRQNYTGRLEAFMKFLDISDPEILIKTDPKTLQRYAEDYVIFLKKKHEKGSFRARSINTYVAPIEHFFVQNDIILNFKKLRKWYPKHEKQTGQEPYSTEDIKKMLAVANLRWSAIIHFFASTGIRPGALYGLKMKNLDFEKFSPSTLVVIYEGENEEYYAFLTPEATSALREYLEKRRFDGEKLVQESPVFRNHFRETTAWQNVTPMKVATFYASFNQLIIKSGVRKPKQERRDRHNKRMFYGFRKRYNTILKNNQTINANTAEKLMGHKNGLDGVYYNPSLEKRFEEFSKAISQLAISEEQRLILKNNQLEEEISEREKSKEREQMLEDKVSRQDQAIAKILSDLEELKKKN